MGFSLKGALKGLSKVASFVPGPVGMAASAVNAGLSGKNPIKAVGGDMTRNAGIAAKLLPIALTGGAAAGAMGAAGGAGAAGAAGGGAMGMLKGLGKTALNNSDLLLGAASMYQGQKQQNKANDLQKRALQMAEQRYADFAPIRTLGLQGMQSTQRRDLSGVYKNPQNPFA